MGSRNKGTNPEKRVALLSYGYWAIGFELFAQEPLNKSNIIIFPIWPLKEEYLFMFWVVRKQFVVRCLLV